MVEERVVAGVLEVKDIPVLEDQVLDEVVARKWTFIEFEKEILLT
jgi:hypothetical protein